MNSHYVYIIEQLGINDETIKMILNDANINNFTEKQRIMQLRYEADKLGVPIFTRKLPTTQFDASQSIYRLDDKVQNCINRNFESDIVDTKIGYMLGIPINYQVDGESRFEDVMTEWNKHQRVADKDAELAKTASITGLAPRLLYVDKEGEPQLRNVDFDEVVIMAKDDAFTPNYALRRYKVPRVNDVGEVVYKQYVEFYDNALIHEFIQNDSGDYELVELEGELNPRPHFFNGCPLFALPNNEEYKGDFEKVIPTIDAYNRTLSDVSDEIEQYRLAYMIMKGMGADEDTLERMKESGVIELYDVDQDVKYLTKDVNDELIENHLDRLEENIYKDAKSVDFSDQNFSSTASGVALMHKTQGLENKCSTFQRKMEATLAYQYELLNYFWSTRNEAEPNKSSEIAYNYRRNLPVDVTEVARSTALLKGNVSESTRLSQLPFVTDTDAEKEAMRNDALELDVVDFETVSVTPLGNITEKTMTTQE